MSIVFCKCGAYIDSDEPENYREEFGDELMCETCYDQKCLEYGEFVTAAVNAEREACAKTAEAEDVADTDFAPGVQECIAAKIRERATFDSYQLPRCEKCERLLHVGACK